MAAPDIDILTQSPLWERIPQAPEVARRALGAMASDADMAGVLRDGGEICLTLTDDAAIAALNREWRGKDMPTNVLSFPAPSHPGPQGPRFFGDIVLAFETVAREAQEQDKEFDAHMAHLVVHGALHLLGHDHVDDEEAERMEALETRILAAIGIADPYAAG